jgi:hypothetical protein
MQVPLTHVVPEAQTAHVPPLEPQAALPVPGTQTLLLQQPPLHVLPMAGTQIVAQVRALPQAMPVGQSPATAQPQKLPFALVAHTWPFALVEQLTQVPLLPHAVAAVPGTQVPVAGSQQPLAQVTPLHVGMGVQIPAVQALPAGQSPVVPQPHIALMQTCPWLLLAQSAAPAHWTQAPLEQT